MGVMRGAEGLQVSFDDGALFAGVVDARGAETEADEGSAGGEGGEGDGEGGGGGAAGDVAGVDVPLILELGDGKGVAFSAEFLVIERHGERIGVWVWLMR